MKSNGRERERGGRAGRLFSRAEWRRTGEQWISVACTSKRGHYFVYKSRGSIFCKKQEINKTQFSFLSIACSGGHHLERNCEHPLLAIEWSWRMHYEEVFLAIAVQALVYVQEIGTERQYLKCLQSSRRRCHCARHPSS